MRYITRARRSRTRYDRGGRSVGTGQSTSASGSAALDPTERPGVHPGATSLCRRSGTDTQERMAQTSETPTFLASQNQFAPALFVGLDQVLRDGLDGIRFELARRMRLADGIAHRLPNVHGLVRQHADHFERGFIAGPDRHDRARVVIMSVGEVRAPAVVEFGIRHPLGDGETLHLVVPRTLVGTEAVVIRHPTSVAPNDAAICHRDA